MAPPWYGAPPGNARPPEWLGAAGKPVILTVDIARTDAFDCEIGRKSITLVTRRYVG